MAELVTPQSLPASSAESPMEPWGPAASPGTVVREGLSVLAAGAGPREEIGTGDVGLYQEIALRG